MHLVFEFPIVDCRPLLAGNKGKLTEPPWSGLSPNSKTFIRNFGAVQQRNAGGSDDWTAEDYFCNTRHLMKYKDLHKQGFKIAKGIVPAIYNSYRRYFSNGFFVGKIEAGFVDNTEKKIRESVLEEGSVSLSDILKHYVNLPVTIQTEESKLYKAGPKLAARYLEESTAEKMAKESQDKMIVAGEIAIIVVYNDNTAFKLPAPSFLLNEIALPGQENSLKLYGYKLKHEGYSLKVWLIKTPANFESASPEAKKVLRNLRINLLRIHLEKETIRILLNSIKSNKIPLIENSPEANLANNYFKNTAEKLFKKERFNLPQKQLLNFALHSEDAVATGSFSSLQDGIYHFQDKYTRDNVEKLITGMAPKIVLFICTSPKDINPLDFGEEFKQIKDSLRRGTDRNNYKIEIETAVRKANFVKILNSYAPDYLHLSMHGSLKDGLFFENEDKEKCAMSVTEFSAALEAYSHGEKTMVIIISACNSKPHAVAAKNYCSYAIGTQAAFPADAGVLYAANFYAGLVADAPLEITECHHAAINAIQKYIPKWDDINNIPVYQIPVLI